MRSLIRWLLRRHGHHPEQDSIPPQLRARLGSLEGWCSIIGNLTMGAVKLFLGLSLHSFGLVADAIHSLADCASSAVIVWGFRLGRQPPDREHPFGHARSEHIATLVVGVLVLVAGFELLLGGFMNLIAADTLISNPPWWVWVVLLAMIVLKEGMAVFSMQLGKIIQSKALEADGAHHHSDSISTAVVMLGLAGPLWGWPWLDGLAGCIVGLLVLWLGAQTAWRAVSPLLGERAPQEMLAHIDRIARAEPAVKDVHDLMVHCYGHYNAISLHIGISDRLSVHRMHHISELLEQRILKHFPGTCVIHVDPLNTSHPLYHRVAEWLKTQILADAELVEYRDLRLLDQDAAPTNVSGTASSKGSVELSISPDVPASQHEALVMRLSAAQRQAFPQLELQIKPCVDFSAAALRADAEPEQRSAASRRASSRAQDEAPRRSS